MRPYTDNIYSILPDCVLLKVKYKNEYIDSYIDKEDLEKVQQKHWRSSHKKNKIYLVTGKSGVPEAPLTYIHNYILDYKTEPGYEVDHIDGNSCNNRKANLRIVSRQENIDNTRVRSDNEIGVRGVSQDRRYGKYVCDFVHHGHRYYFKLADTIAEAVCMRKAAEELFGIETISRNPKAQQYLSLLSEQQVAEIYQYVLEKVS